MLPLSSVAWLLTLFDLSIAKERFRYRSTVGNADKVDDKEVQDVDDAEEEAMQNETEAQNEQQEPGMEITDPR